MSVQLSSLIKSDSDSHLYDMYQSCKLVALACYPCPDTRISEGSVANIFLKTNVSGMHLRNALSTMLTDSSMYKGPADIEDSELQLTPNPTDIVAVPVDAGCKTLVIADNSNKCLLIVNLVLGGKPSCLHIAKAPSLCKINPYQVVASIPEKKKELDSGYCSTSKTYPSFGGTMYKQMPEMHCGHPNV